MKSKNNEKERSIILRKRGFSYSEILNEVRVSKSTLSLWLSDVVLTNEQKQVIAEKKHRGVLNGALVRKQKRIESVTKIYDQAALDIKNITARELWMIGIALYWAEGSKEKEYRPGISLQFSNSDGAMIRLYVEWLRQVFGVSDGDIVCQIYIHENCKGKLDSVKKYWTEQTGLPSEKFSTFYFKKNKIRSRRKNIGNSYNGVLRVKVKASSVLLRKVSGWIKRIAENNWGIV